MKTAWVVALASPLIKHGETISGSTYQALRSDLSTAGTLSEFIGRIENSSLSQKSEVLRLLQRVHEFEEAIDVMSEGGISVISEFSKEYPAAFLEKLRGKHPPVLYAAGDISVLKQRFGGFVGSRDASETDLELTHRRVTETIELGLGVVSGGAKGIDQFAAKTALEAGAPVLEIVSDSLVTRSRDLSDHSHLMISPYIPTAGFSAGNAMSRNKLIYAMSEWTIIVCSAHGSGGTWGGAVEALKHQLSPVIVLDQEHLSGNQALIAQGGVRLKKTEPLRDKIAGLPVHVQNLFS